MFNDEYFMRQALLEANNALERDEVPVGCVIVHNQKIIARGYNLIENLNDVTAHAEIQAITAASNSLGGKYLINCNLYVTLEPCVMCAGAIFWSQLSRVIIGARDEKRGFKKNSIALHPKTSIKWNILEQECSNIIKSFFETKR